MIIPHAPVEAPPRMLDLTIDDKTVTVTEGATLLEACRQAAIETPTLCYLENLTPVNACRVCVVEVEGSRVLMPSCARKAEAGMVVKTDSERVRHSRKMVLEFLGSSVDLSTAPDAQRYITQYDADPSRYGANAETVAQPIKIDNELYVRDYSKCIACYKCVEACGTDAQNTFAIAMAGRGFGAHISTEFEVPLPGSCLLRQLYRRLPDRCPHVQLRAPKCVNPEPGTKRSRPPRIPYARTAAWDAHSPCTYKTTPS